MSPVLLNELNRLAEDLAVLVTSSGERAPVLLRSVVTLAAARINQFNQDAENYLARSGVSPDQGTTVASGPIHPFMRFRG